jgi:catechol 2,3-dioxygenase-like lactoylglutathione lyase family enzyme
MIDHVSLAVRDLAASAAFYERLLMPLGYSRLVERPRSVGFGKRYPELWLNARPALEPVPDGTGAHVALRAASEDAVRAFHAAALDHGGRCGGPPGARPAAMTTYFGAFILDPDGNKVEALFIPSQRAS